MGSNLINGEIRLIQLVRFVCSVLLLMTLSISSVGAAPSIAKQRIWFQEAKAALKADDLLLFQTLKERLKDYPLLPYLDIWHARKKLDQGDDLGISTLLNRHADIPEVTDLRLARIRDLAERGQWPHVALALEKYTFVAKLLPDVAIMSLWYTGKKAEAFESFSKRWQRGHDASELTARLDQQWKQQGHPTRDELWERIGTFAKRGAWKKTRKLEQSLSQKDRKWIKRWRAMQRDPLKQLQQWKAKKQKIPALLIVNDGLQRLSRSDAHSAWKVLHRLKSIFEENKFSQFQKRIALRAASQHVLPAAKWLAALPEASRSIETRAWQIRLQLLYGNWNAAMQLIAALPELEQRESRWVYWQARALEKLGRERESKALFKLAATGRGYYSFISAERLRVPYQLNERSLDTQGSTVRKFKKAPGIVRAYEWHKLGETGKAGREWNRALMDASVEQWKAAAYIASKWGWHDQAIRAAHMAGEVNALTHRFPTAFEQAVAGSSKESGLSLSLIWSIIRQESAFNQRAVSRIGAQGLMQLRPGTARDVARRHKVDKGKPNLFDPTVNIRLGSLYLSKLHERFDRNSAIAAAAYNAGPRRVSEWLEKQPFGDADIWIETIPFRETRHYVQQVLAFTVVYDWRQSKKPVGIAGRMNLVNEEG